MRAGWSEPEAREANVGTLAGAQPWDVARVDADGDLVEEILGRSRDRAQGFDGWLEQLRSGDPVFAETSGLYPGDMSEWHAGVYLLTGCDEVWSALGGSVLADSSIAPAIEEREKPRRAWSSSETQVLRWAAHFWDVDRWSARFPYEFEEFYFQRWVDACQLCTQASPIARVTAGGPQGVR
jgi:hypothetical protein